MRSHTLHLWFEMLQASRAFLPSHGPGSLCIDSCPCISVMDDVHTQSGLYKLQGLYLHVLLPVKLHVMQVSCGRCSCSDRSCSCVLVVYFTHDCPPLYTSSHGWRCSFPNFAYEIKSHLRGTMSRPPHLSVSCSHYWGDTIESLIHINLGLKWLSPAGQILTGILFSLKRALYHQEKGRKDERASEKERKVKKLMFQWHPFSHNRGNFCSITGSG